MPHYEAVDNLWELFAHQHFPSLRLDPGVTLPSHMPSISDDSGQGWDCVCVSGEIFDVILGDVDVIKMTLMLWCHITLETEILTTLPCHVRAKIFSFEWIATLQWNVEAIQLISLQTELTAQRKHCYPRDNHFFVQCWDAVCFNKDFQECSS